LFQVSSAVSVAYFSSIALLALAAVQMPSHDGLGDSTTFFDSVVFLTMFLLAGRYLEAYSKARTTDAVTSLSSLRPAKALVVVPITESVIETPIHPSHHDDIEKGVLDEKAELHRTQAGYQVEKIDVSLLEVGDIVRVGTGATPPADGIIVEGEEGAFDESSLTGESKLIRKSIGDKVFLGTINKSKAVDVRVGAHVGGTM
jgi:Cu+-exporting ATPase